MTPRRRTLVLVLLTLGTAAVLVPAAYLGFEATIGSSHAADSCSATPGGDAIAMRAVAFGSTQRWTWFPPGYDVTCLYRMPDGSTIARPK